MRQLLLRSLPPVVLLTLLLLQPGAAMQGIRSGLSLWADAVLPALLPFYVAAELLLQCGALRLLSPLLRPVCRLLRLPDDSGGLLLTGWLCGAPGGARLLAQVQEDASVCTRLCACFTVTGPLFLIGTAGHLLGSPLLGALLYGIHIFTAVCNGFLWRGYGSNTSDPAQAAFPESSGFLSALPEALRSSSLSLLFIGGTIAFFSAVTSVLQAIGLTAALTRVLHAFLPTDAVSALLAGFFEVSQGTFAAAQARLSLPLRLSLLCAFASFGGVSVLCQAKVFLQQRVRTSVYFLQRLTHAGLSFALCRALCLAAGRVLPAMQTAASLPASAPVQAVSWLLPAACVLFSLLPGKIKGR